MSVKVQRRIKHQEELDLTFCSDICSTPGGEQVSRCIQCGTCSSTCPMSVYMDLTPRKVIAMTRAGFKDEVLASNTIWLCSSCYACTVECPKEIKITDVMYALKQKAMDEKRYPARFPIPVLAKEFFNSVMKTGRSNEGQILTKMFLKTNPFKMLTRASLGLKLLMRGRMTVKTERMSGGTGQLKKLMDAVEKAEA